MKFSVLINNYNNEPYLRECLESLLHQSRPADEIIVVDDGSTDASRTIIEEYAAQFAVIKPVYQKNGGQISAVATGIFASSGDVLFLLDGDDAYKPNHLESMEKYWRKHPHIDFIYSRSDLINPSSLSESQIEEQKENTRNLIGPVKNIAEPYECGCSAVLAYFYPWYYMGNTTSTLSVKRNHATSLGLEKIVKNSLWQFNNADYALLLTSALHLGRKLYVPDETVLYRIHENSITYKRSKQGNDIAFHKYFWLMRVKFLKCCCLKDFPPLLQLFDFDVIEEEIKTIPNPSQAHLECYKVATKLAKGRTHELEETIKKREAHLNSLYNSLSWKITKPLRVLGNIISAVLK
ncbi:MAG: glycosyltransferase family 2 protein [Chthoniobacterales bacterium]